MTALRKAQAELLEDVLRGVRSPLRESLHRELTSWLVERKRFAVLLSANRDKVRKKLRAASGDAALLDVRAELLVAALLCADRRFELAFEPYGSARGGPDFMVVFRENQRFDLEVTRLRSAPPGASDGDSVRLARALLAKLPQLKPGVPNVVALVTRASPSVAAVAAILRTLKTRVGARGTVPVTRLSAIVTLGDDGGALSLAPDARHPLQREVAVALSRCLGALR